MKSKLISIVIPCYNSELYISRTLECVYKQTYRPLEVVIIDDGSNDRTIDIVNQFFASHVDTKIYSKIIKKNNSGVSNSRNIGINIAKGENIFFLDSDDVIPPTYIKALSDNMKNYYSVVSTNMKRFVQEENIDFTENNPFEKKTIAGNSNICSYFRPFFNKYYFNSASNKLYNLNLIIENNIWFNTDLDMGEDLLFNISLLPYIKTWIVLDEVYYYYRINFQSLTFSFREDYLEKRFLLIDSIRRSRTSSFITSRDLKKEEIKAMYSNLIMLNNHSRKISRNKLDKEIRKSNQLMKNKITIKQLKEVSLMFKFMGSMLFLPNFILNIWISLITFLWNTKMKSK